MDRLNSLNLWVQACLSNEQTKLELLKSPHFLIEDGRNWGEFVKYELEQYQTLSKAAGLYEKAWGLNIVSECINNKHVAVAFNVIATSTGLPFFRMTAHLDENNLWVGNGCYIEMVAKRSILNNKEIGLHIALSSRAILNHWVLPSEKNYIISLEEKKAKEDGFRTVELAGEAFKGLWFMMSSGGILNNKPFSERRPLYLPLRDDTLNPLISIQARKVNVNANLLPVNLFVKTEGGCHNIAYPRDNIYLYQDEIVEVVITDVIDHDWQYKKNTNE